MKNYKVCKKELSSKEPYNSYRTQLIKAVDYFRKKAPSQIFDRVLNMPQILNMQGLHQGVVIVDQLCHLNYDDSLVT